MKAFALVLASSVSVLALGNPAFAEEADAPEANASAPSEGFGEIVVTAARHEQSLQKVSATVNVLDGDAMAQTATANVTQALASTPGVNTTSQPGGSSINMRGLGADTPSGSTQGAVALEFDGVYNIISLGTQVGLLDVNRVEVLKGPQGTRYGPNAEGGIVNVITNDPVLDDWSGNAMLTVGNYGLVRGEVAQNIALGDKVALRVAGAAIDRKSYFTPAASDNVAQSLRIKLLAEPTDDLTIKLAYQRDHLGGTGVGTEAGYPIIISRVAPYAGDSINDAGDPWSMGDVCAADNADPSVTDCPSDNKADVTQQTFSGAISYSISDAVALDVSGAYTRISGEEYSCADNGPPWGTSGTANCFAVYQYDPFNQYATEVRLHSDGGPVQWNLGYYYWDYDQYKWAEGFQAVSGREGGTELGTRTNAVFGEVTYPVTDRLRLIGGARQSWDRRLLKPSGVSETFTAKLSHFDFRLGEEYDLSPDVMQYFTVATGYRPGGITYNGSLGAASVFDNEETTSYELGLKSKLFDNRLILNLSAFYYDQTNYQDIDSYAGFDVVLQSDSNAGNAGDTYTCRNGGGQPAECATPTFSIANAYNIGLEWQAQFMASPADVFGFSGTLMKARFSNSQGTCATVAAPTTEGCWIGYNDQNTGELFFYDAAGSTQPHSPTLSMRVSYEHTFTFDSGATFAIGGDAFHSSGYWVHPVHDASLLGYQPGYWQENLNARFVDASGRYSIGAFVKNLSDYAVKQSTLPATTISDPRTFGVTVGVNW